MFNATRVARYLRECATRYAIPSHTMAGTRRSTRQSASAAPQYADTESSVSEDEAPKRKSKSTRQKRAREVDDVKDDQYAMSTPTQYTAHVLTQLLPCRAPRKKAARTKADASKPASKPVSKPSAKPKGSTTTSSQSTSLEPSSDTNRDASGAQEVYWLLKAEPLPRYENGVNVAFSIDDLAACTEPEPWGGVRNPLACKNMRTMRKGDLGFFYHSNAKPSGVVGILRIVEEAKVDETAFDPKDPYYDKKSDREKPRWFCVGVEFVKKFADVVDLATIKANAQKGGRLEGMQLVTNSRLSVNRVRKDEWDFISELAGETPGETAGAQKMDVAAAE